MPTQLPGPSPTFEPVRGVAPPPFDVPASAVGPPGRTHASGGQTHGAAWRAAQQAELPLLSPAALPALRSRWGHQLLTEFLDARGTVEIALAALAAERRTGDDCRALGAATLRLEVVALTTADHGADHPARVFATVELLQAALGRAARNRFLAAESRTLFDRLRDGADWLAPQLATPSTASQYWKLANAVAAGNSQEAAAAAEALADLVESWIWRRLAQP